MYEELNAIRRRIMARMDEYTSLHALMGEFENHYLSFVLLPSYRLQQTIHMANYLEQEYSRISSAIQRGLLADPEEVEAEVRNTLRHADFAFTCLPRERPYDSDSTNGMNSASETPEFEMDSDRKQTLIREFKRVVLPRVHADTSEAPFEVFNTVYEAYKRKDWLLMAAFVIQFRGELPPSAKDAAAFALHAPEYLKEYRAVLDGMERRLTSLKEDPAAGRLENRDQILNHMKQQNLEIRKAVTREEERVLLLRSCLEELLQKRFSNYGVN